MGKWEIVRLGDVCEVVSGSTPSTRNPDLWNGKIKWIAPAEICDDSYYIYDTVKHISAKAGLKLMPAGTVLLSSRAPIGKVAIAGEEMCCNQGFKNLVCSNRIYNRYLYRYLKNQTRYLNSLGRGATFKEISKPIVEQIKIPLPPLPIQQQIADVLDCASALIEKRKAQINKLDLLVKSQLIEMFGDPVTNPMGWEKRQLKKECDVVTGNTPSRSNPRNYGEFIEWIKSDNINTPHMYLTKASEMLSETGSVIGRSVEAGAILMTCIAGSISCIGNIAISDRKVSFNQQINAIIPKDNNVYYMYYQLLLSKPYIQSTVNMSLKGILSKGKLLELEFLFPPLSLQTQFADFVHQVEAQKSLLQASLAKLEQNYKSLMQKCFRGEIF